MSNPRRLSKEQLSAFASLALENIQREYPNKLDHVMNNADEIRSPRALHPVFYGSYDWHSSVHMHWLLARLLRLAPDLAEAPRVRNLFDLHFCGTNVSAELAYLEAPSRQSFERTYGWAWLLKLQSDLMALERTSAVPASHARWRRQLQPLADAFVARYLHFLPLADYPIRAGTHANSAFGLYFALAYSRQACNQALEAAILQKALGWFGRDIRYPANYEPGGDDFLSGGLMEAALMAQVLGDRFPAWWDSFRPEEHALQAWLHPAAVTDRSDPKFAHLDGLNLSRAWCWKILRSHLGDSRLITINQAIDDHLDASLPHAAIGDYAGTHWLASFALLALSEE